MTTTARFVRRGASIAVSLLTLLVGSSLAAERIEAPRTNTPAPSVPADASSSLPRNSGSVSNAYANALDVVLPSPPDTNQLVTRAAHMYVDALSNYYAYYAAALEHRRNIFAWQLTSGKITFTVVVLLVISGIFFAGWQFFRDRVQTESEVEATAQGIKVSSHVLGVIILSLSLIFFYLYLVYVYPIHEAIAATGH